MALRKGMHTLPGTGGRQFLRLIGCVRHKLSYGVIAIMAVVASLIGMQQAQAAAGDYSRVAVSTPLRACQDTRCGVYKTVPANTSVQTWCWRDGNSSNGSSRWFRVTYAGTQGWVSTSAINPQAIVPNCDSMNPGERLYQNESVWSSDGRYRLIMQTDGNLVVYGPSGALWASNTGRTSGYFAAMQSDGNLVVYNSSGQPLWWTGTMFAGTRLVMQSDSNLVEYTGSRPLWASNWHVYRGQRTYPAGSANPGDFGNCTNYAIQRFSDFWSRHLYPYLWGNAENWNDAALAQSPAWQVIGTPITQAIVVFEPYVQGSGSVGHVAWVDAIRPRADGGTDIHVIEMNFREADGSGGFNKVSQRWVQHVSGMSYLPAPAI